MDYGTLPQFERRGHTDWQWTMAALVAFAILDYLRMGTEGDEMKRR
jgi:hypothetical protein